MSGQPAKAKNQTAKQRAAQARREKLERMRREEERARRRRFALIGGGTTVLVAAIVAGIVAIWPSNTSSATTVANADTSTGLLAPAAAVTGSTIDGVSANSNEQVAYHIHAHLAIYVNGAQKLIPYAIGIEAPLQVQQASTGAFAGGAGYYYMHTHDETGVIHIESPTTAAYTLGQFFAVWGQKLSDTQVGSAKGTVTTYVDGKLFTGNPSTISLTAHKLIQLDVGKVVAPVSFTFPSGE
jgi:hypothetical protein